MSDRDDLDVEGDDDSRDYLSDLLFASIIVPLIVMLWKAALS